MEKMWTLIKKFAKEEEGTETVEWAILAALLLAVVAGVWTVLGNTVTAKIQDIAGTISGS
jgi:Flp pilus assembly pilin Flp